MNVKYFITGTGNDEDDITEFSMIFLDSERKHKNGKESIWDGLVYFITEYDDEAYAFYPVYGNSLQYSEEVTEAKARKLCPGMFYWVDKYIKTKEANHNEPTN